MSNVLVVTAYSETANQLAHELEKFGITAQTVCNEDTFDDTLQGVSVVVTDSTIQPKNYKPGQPYAWFYQPEQLARIRYKPIVHMPAETYGLQDWEIVHVANEVHDLMPR